MMFKMFVLIMIMMTMTMDKIMNCVPCSEWNEFGLWYFFWLCCTISSCIYHDNNKKMTNFHLQTRFFWLRPHFFLSLCLSISSKINFSILHINIYMKLINFSLLVIIWFAFLQYFQISSHRVFNELRISFVFFFFFSKETTKALIVQPIIS